jgi:hypothetical protein
VVVVAIFFFVDPFHVWNGDENQADVAPEYFQAFRPG